MMETVMAFLLTSSWKSLKEDIVRRDPWHIPRLKKICVAASDQTVEMACITDEMVEIIRL